MQELCRVGVAWSVTTSIGLKSAYWSSLCQPKKILVSAARPTLYSLRFFAVLLALPPRPRLAPEPVLGTACVLPERDQSGVGEGGASPSSSRYLGLVLGC